MKAQQLAGLWCLNTRPRGDGKTLTMMLGDLGARVSRVPMLEVNTCLSASLDRKLRDDAFLEHRLLLFTSANAVRAVKRALDFMRASVGVIGEKTAASVRAYGGEPILVGRHPEASAFSRQVVQFVKSRRDEFLEVLWLRGDTADLGFLRAFGEVSIRASEEVVYCVKAADLSEEELGEFRSFSTPDDGAVQHHARLVVLTSAESARRFCQLLAKHSLDSIAGMELFFAAIGAKTADVGTSLGLKLAVKADYTSIESLVSGIGTWWDGQRLFRV